MFVSDAEARLQVARQHADVLARDYRGAQRADDHKSFALRRPKRLPARARHLLKRLAAAAALLGVVAAVAAPGATAKNGGPSCSTVSRGGACRLANVLAGGPLLSVARAEADRAPRVPRKPLRRPRQHTAQPDLLLPPGVAVRHKRLIGQIKAGDANPSLAVIRPSAARRSERHYGQAPRLEP